MSPHTLFQLFHILTVYKLYCQDAFREHNLFLMHDFLTAWFVFMFAENFKMTVALGQRITFVKLHVFLELINSVGNRGCDKTTARLKGKSWKDRKAKSVPPCAHVWHLSHLSASSSLPLPCSLQSPFQGVSMPQCQDRWFPKVTCRFCPAKKPRWTFWVCTFKRYAAALQDVVETKAFCIFWPKCCIYGLLNPFWGAINFWRLELSFEKHI